MFYQFIHNYIEFFFKMHIEDFPQQIIKCLGQPLEINGFPAFRERLSHPNEHQLTIYGNLFLLYLNENDNDFGRKATVAGID